MKNRVVMDATILSAFMGCARFFDLRHNHLLVPMRGKSNSLECGSLAHKVLEVYYKHIINGFTRQQAIGQGITAGELYIAGCKCADETVDNPPCNHQPGEYPGLMNTPEKNEGKIIGSSWVLETMNDYFKFYEGDHWIPLEAEVVKKKILYEDDEISVLWKSKLDLYVDTNQGILSADHKTFKQRRDKISLSNQFIGQCLVLDTRNVIVNKIGFQTSLKPHERFTREMVSYSSDRLLEWQSEILPYYAYRLLQYKEAQHYPPNFTHCENLYGRCEYSEVCESNPNMRAEILRGDFRKTRIWDVMNVTGE